MDEINSQTLLQLTNDELAEVLEELTGLELSEAQVSALRRVIEAAGSLEAAWDLLNEIGPSAEAA